VVIDDARYWAEQAIGGGILSDLVSDAAKKSVLSFHRRWG
jgi:hypothetical protein